MGTRYFEFSITQEPARVWRCGTCAALIDDQFVSTHTMWHDKLDVMMRRY